MTSVRRIDFGYFVRPASETGTGGPRVEPCFGYLVEHADGVLLFDTGMGAHPEVDAHYRPRRRGLADALGARCDDVTLVANSHLHFDHCGGNPLLAHAPVVVQRVELANARTTQDYTLPELLEGVTYDEVDGEAEVLTGVRVLPTPGHTDGHQSLVVRGTDGVVVVAGQSHDNATAFGADALAGRARREAHGEPLPVPPVWIETLLALDPSRVVFAHDASVWVP
ncbi:MAG: N-acyl homoserine lactone hydrolase [Actinomycetota bacterium]|jgi:N-acyl homoserine lactone hydrolase|nr:N-acyl homoserine lactone hydrolase [Actinomycetota bacterium]